KRQQRAERGCIHVEMNASLDRVDLRDLVHPDDAAPARVVQSAFALGIRLPGQSENLRPERPGREWLGGVEADFLESRDGHPLHGSAVTSLARPPVPMVEDLDRPRRLDPIPRLHVEQRMTVEMQDLEQPLHSCARGLDRDRRLPSLGSAPGSFYEWL